MSQLLLFVVCMQVVFVLLLVVIDYLVVFVLCQMVMQYDDYLKYLLVLEVSVLFYYVFDLYCRMLLVILWNIGVWINEVLVLIWGDFLLVLFYLFVQLVILKQWVEKVVRMVGWMLFGSQFYCLVLFFDNQYVSELQMMVVMLKILLECCNRCIGRMEKVCFWEIIDWMVCIWIGEVVEVVVVDDVMFLVLVIFYIFCYFYVMYMLYVGILLKVLQVLMGYKLVSLMEVYMKVFVFDVVV